MDHHSSNNSLTKKIIFSAVLLALALLCSVTAIAYFTTRAVVRTENSAQFASIGMRLDLLFDRIDDNTPADTDIGTGTPYAPDADWGSAANPYVISDIRHLQNLSVLQEIGYFDTNYISKNFDENKVYTGGTEMPYFLVCKPDGTPVTINGSDITFSPIGTDEYPFIGFVGGAFSEGTTTVGGKQSDTSAIYNITVQTDTDVIDVGLFGSIGYLGTEPETPGEVFQGAVSTVEDLLLYDVKIVVNKPSLLSQIADTLVNHLFLYHLVDAAEIDNVPHENHHIGILAGHVAYAKVNYISVYYSGMDIAAIDLTHTTTTYEGKAANYLSNTGIIGFLYNMNPEISENGITAGSGDSSSSISINSAIGTGGGLASGTGRGYVTASELYTLYAPNDGGDLRLMDAVDEKGEPLVTQYYRKRLFGGIFFPETQATNLYYFYDGVFTFALSSENTSDEPNQDKIENTWNNEADAADTFTVGENLDSRWKKNTTKGNNSVVAYVKEITSLEALEQVVANGQQIYIGYDQGTTVSLMSLTNSDAGSSDWFDNFSDNKYTTDAFTRTWFTDDNGEITSIQETLQYALVNGEQIEGMLPRDKNGNVIQNVIDNIGDYLLIDLGSADDLELLKNQYPINVTKGTTNTSLYRFENNRNYLALLRQLRTGIISGSTNTYSIWAGDSTPPNTSGLLSRTTYFWQNEASVVYENGYFNIQFHYDSGDGQTASRYVQYDNTNDKFKGSSDQVTETRLKLYTVEGTSNLNFGRITYDPVDASAYTTFNADEAVLWPQATYPGNGGRDAATVPHAAYSIKRLQGALLDEEVLDQSGYLTAADGWKNRVGKALQYSDLHKKFSMERSASWGATLTGLNGNISIGDGTIVAPVGTLGVEANIPLGTIAFRVNKAATADNPNRINVIVAVPQCDYYKGENDAGTFYDDGLNYFGLWHVTANGEAIVSTFNADNAIEKFELPRSNPFEPSSTPGGSDYILIQNEDGTTSRCYLNGNRALVAYQFEVIDEGVYLLGATNGPMEIVYFSADNTASAGRDGSSGSKLGTIDFVYDDLNGTVVTVNKPVPEGTPPENPNANGEDYHYYYASLCLMYTDNGVDGFPDINDLQIYVRRFIDGAENEQISNMMLQVNSDSGQNDYLQLVPYSISSDKVTRAENGTR